MSSAIPRSWSVYRFMRESTRYGSCGIVPRCHVNGCGQLQWPWREGLPENCSDSVLSARRERRSPRTVSMAERGQL